MKTESPFTVQSIAVFKDIYGFSSGNTSFEALAAMEYELPTDEKMPLPERYAVYQGSQIRTVLVPYYKMDRLMRVNKTGIMSYLMMCLNRFSNDILQGVYSVKFAL